MGDEDKLEIIDWTDEYDHQWNYSQSPTYSDVETWLIEKSIEATSSKHSESNIDAQRELYLLKCKVDRIYDSLPVEPALERDWDKEAVHRILKDSK